ncbi:hypothetical protein GGP41_004843 [Bipolaris sorokiniana]|uniref:Uncharacterized protein n=1 Tax=Cochliobolus sativus TaxID=45130 RepID=A0A8H5ZCU2_COCSA|nr:hypothetical protein GGP41_004843 [Bipolaris sorokiniana]
MLWAASRLLNTDANLASDGQLDDGKAHVLGQGDGANGHAALIAEVLRILVNAWKGACKAC